ncbi:MAG TPA: DUF3443 family protein [Nitrospirota bacterium]|nr:DUF3443 family protein [Nitrospirota bacterium]
MISSRIQLILVLALVAGCGGGGSGGGFIIPPPTLKSIAVTPANPNVALGITEQFTATGTYSDNSLRDITTSVTWTSSAPNVASISNTAGSEGLAGSGSQGQTTITATLGIVSNFTDLTVTPPVLATIDVDPANPSIALGSGQQFTATGHYSDNTTSDLTTSVTWTASAPDIAIISNATGSQGSATPVAAGTTAIIAISGPVRGAAVLTVTGGVPTAANVLPITVNGSLCSSNSYPNKPCISVTVCTPGTATCQTVNDIVMDTGSSGLRIFKVALNGLALLQITSGSGSLATCAQFGDGSSEWGPVQSADVILGNEPAVKVPIQVIDATFDAIPAASGCQNADATPTAAGFNGMLGVGLFNQDCGPYCEDPHNLNIKGLTYPYFSCTGKNCTQVTVSLADQVQNPIVSLPTDSNGVIVQLPSVVSTGTTSVNGILVLGIGTQSNNIPSGGVTAFAADPFGDIRTIFGGNIYGSFIDSGSNGLYFDASSTSALPDCGGFYSGLFCPQSLYTSPATINASYTGSPSNTVTFQIDNAITLLNSQNSVLPDLGGSAPGMFDWGLPFYLGRSVYVGIDGQISALGTGPYFAY